MDKVVYDRIDKMEGSLTETQSGIYDNIRKNRNRFIYKEFKSSGQTSVVSVSGKGVLYYLIIGCMYVNNTSKALVTVDDKVFNFTATLSASYNAINSRTGVMARESIIGMSTTSDSFAILEGENRMPDLGFNNCRPRKLSDEDGGSIDKGVVLFTETGLKFDSKLNITVSTSSTSGSSPGVTIYCLYTLED